MISRFWSIHIAIATAVSVAAPLASAAASCDTLEPCAAKACRLDADIAQAKAKGNTLQRASLERARAEMVHCSDDGLKQKRKVALEQAQRRIDQREGDLRKAEASRDAAKVKKAQRKLESARKAYTEIEKSPL
jgi:exonuclease VII large subunit